MNIIKAWIFTIFVLVGSLKCSNIDNNAVVLFKDSTELIVKFTNEIGQTFLDSGTILFEKGTNYYLTKKDGVTIYSKTNTFSVERIKMDIIQ